MAIKSLIEDGAGNNHIAKVTEYGQLVTSPAAYSSSSSAKLELDNTAYSLASPLAGNLIVITDILLYANKNVSATTEATVTLYSSTVGPNETTVSNTILLTEMTKQTSRDITGSHLVTEAGSWVNAKTSDDDIFITILYYYLT